LEYFLPVDSVKIIIQGYARRKDNDRWDATSTTVLVQSAGKLILIDPGCDPEKLKSALKNDRLSLDDIDIVIVSHSHYDHSRNTRLFVKNKVCNISLFFQRQELIKNTVLIPGTEIIVLRTPGHVDRHVAFLVNTAAGKCAIAGDVFWWEDGQEQKVDFQSLINQDDPLAKNMSVLQNSRLNLIKCADFIIPGHGKEFIAPK
jgi:glyoxylase-like metal-dependent hydrolase (beta-lactamase superfamily II)